MDQDLKQQLLDDARPRVQKRFFDPNFEVECLVGIWACDHHLRLAEMEELLAELGLDRIWPQEIPICDLCGRFTKRDMITDRFTCPLHGDQIATKIEKVFRVPDRVTPEDELLALATADTLHLLPPEANIASFQVLAEELLRYRGVELPTPTPETATSA